MSHDQLSKSLIATFFHDFLRLTVPDAEPLLRPGDATFVDKEVFTDWPTGQRRELDLLARVPLAGGDTHVLVHVEIESEARAGMDERLWHYYMQIRVSHHLLVLPILVNLRGGRPGVGPGVLEEGLLPLATGTFRYSALGVAGCDADDWLARPEPIAWAFAALMRPGKRSRAELRMDCLRRVARWGVTGFRKEVLANWIETYVKLSDEEAVEFQRLLEQEENMEVREMELTWLGEAEARGEERGEVRGIEKGVAQGMAQALEQMKQAVLQRVEQRFGVLPERLRRKVQAADSVDPLVEMIARIPFVGSADELA